MMTINPEELSFSDLEKVQTRLLKILARMIRIELDRRKGKE